MFNFPSLDSVFGSINVKEQKIIDYGSKQNNLILHLKNLLLFENGQHVTDVVESIAVLISKYSDETVAYALLLSYLKASGIELKEPILKLEKSNLKTKLPKKVVRH